jgi:hypothetical protein
MFSLDDIPSDISESELSDTLNTSTFDIHTYVITGELASAETNNDFI